jgi:N-acetylneuraminate synthase
MIEIEGVEVGPGQPCRFVAEISNNHNGNEERVVRLIEAAKRAGADFVKFQAYTPDELIALRPDPEGRQDGGPAPDPWGSEGHSMRSLYELARTPLEWFSGLFQAARTIRIVPCASVFGMESLAMLESVECPAYKVAAFDVGSDFARALALRVEGDGNQSGNYIPIIASSRADSVPWADLTLYCPEGYPQQEADLVRHAMPSPVLFRGEFDGFSYHGTNPDMPILAAAMGAKLVECHFQLDDEPSALESDVSLTESQFRQMVEASR